MTTQHLETVIIGAGQAGLSTAYHLTRRDRPCLVLEAEDRVGDVWRRRFDSLRLFTPAVYDSLPGLPMPLGAWEFPTGRQMGDYLETYATRMRLPVRTGVSIDGIARVGDRFVMTSGHTTYTADHVVVASGGWSKPKVPDFATELDPAIRQLHSAEYHGPAQLQPGPVLVVGASHSGADLALELAKAGHPTELAGRIHGQIPFRISSRVGRVMLPVVWFVWNHVLTEATPIGRKARDGVRGGGGLLVRVKRRDLAAAGVRHSPERVTGVADGRPVLADGRVLDVANVLWCTGFGRDTSWIDVPLGGPGAGAADFPDQTRGVVPSAPGLYFVGLPFQRGFYSMLVGGVARDADYVAGHITASVTSGRRTPSTDGSPRVGSVPSSSRKGPVVKERRLAELSRLPHPSQQQPSR